MIFKSYSHEDLIRKSDRELIEVLRSRGGGRYAPAVLEILRKRNRDLVKENNRLTLEIARRRRVPRMGHVAGQSSGTRSLLDLLRSATSELMANSERDFSEPPKLGFRRFPESFLDNPQFFVPAAPLSIASAKAFSPRNKLGEIENEELERLDSMFVNLNRSVHFQILATRVLNEWNQRVIENQRQVNRVFTGKVVGQYSNGFVVTLGPTSGLLPSEHLSPDTRKDLEKSMSRSGAKPKTQLPISVEGRDRLGRLILSESSEPV